jgi:hypothetical protein
MTQNLINLITFQPPQFKDEEALDRFEMDADMQELLPEHLNGNLNQKVP